MVVTSKSTWQRGSRLSYNASVIVSLSGPISATVADDVALSVKARQARVETAKYLREITFTSTSVCVVTITPHKAVRGRRSFSLVSISRTNAACDRLEGAAGQRVLAL